MLEAVAKRYPFNVGKIAESAATECAARRKKRQEHQKAPKNGKPSPNSKSARNRMNRAWPVIV
jgi:hypothetical protein